MTQFHEQYSDEESAFVEAFGHGGGTICSIECHCGRVYFCTERGHGDYGKGELESLIEAEEKYPYKYFSNSEFSSIEWVNLDGRHYVPQCDCGEIAKRIEWMEDHLEQIAAYAAIRLKKKREQVEEELNRVSELETNLTKELEQE